MAEIWKAVVGFEGLYEVSNLGRVRGLRRIRFAKNRWGKTGARTYPAKMLKPYVNARRGGYRYVNLHDAAGQHMRRVACLVAGAFIGPRPLGHDVCHNDGCAANDCVDNLRYDTKKANSQDTLRHGRRPYGEGHRSAKLTLKQVKSIRNSNEPQRLIAQRHGVSQQHVSNIRTGQRWAHV